MPRSALARYQARLPRDQSGTVSSLCLVLTRDTETWNNRLVHADHRSVLMLGAGSLPEARALLKVVRFQVVLLLDDHSALEQQLLLTPLGTGCHGAVMLIPDRELGSCMVHLGDGCFRLAHRDSARSFDAFLTDVAVMLALGGAHLRPGRSCLERLHSRHLPIAQVSDDLAATLKASLSINLQRLRASDHASLDCGIDQLVQKVFARARSDSLHACGVTLRRDWMARLVESGSDAAFSCPEVLGKLIAQARSLGHVGALASVGVPIELQHSALESVLDSLMQLMSKFAMRPQQFMLEVSALELKHGRAADLKRLMALHDAGFGLMLRDYDGLSPDRQVLQALPFSFVKFSAVTWPEPWALERAECWLHTAQVLRLLVADCHDLGQQCVLEGWLPNEIDLIARMAGFDWLQE